MNDIQKALNSLKEIFDQQKIADTANLTKQKPGLYGMDDLLPYLIKQATHPT